MFGMVCSLNIIFLEKLCKNLCSIWWINEMVITRIHKARSTHRPAAATNLHPRLSGTRKEGCWLAFQRDPVIFYNLLHRSL
ncbi:hypothetical protein SORBI_3002G125100 [Sorghum bicolor]|uniref:Uncharacterized protein n=1 Tax=Sorghum bicolor TaxID=4558 RepID=A0A1B6QAU9_SORBI|nr:hypothetical protein SORBI_3002G125100 [Sorghum bicolor]